MNGLILENLHLFSFIQYFLLAEHVFNYLLSIRPSVSKSPILVPTTPPEPMDGLRIKFQKMLSNISCCASDEKVYNAQLTIRAIAASTCTHYF